MPAKVVPVSDEDYARQKQELAARAVRAVVTGDQPIRDCLTRESAHKGQTVHLDPDTTVIDHLVRSGAVRLVEAKAADAKG